VKLAFVRGLLPTEFFDHPTVGTARHACRGNPDELRAMRVAGTEGTVKLPLFGSVLDDIREHIWHNKTFFNDLWVSRILDDLVIFLVRSGANGRDDELSSFRLQSQGSRS
jgi:hypothetical protein